jgi:hypothetical protein
MRRSRFNINVEVGLCVFFLVSVSKIEDGWLIMLVVICGWELVIQVVVKLQV